MVTGFTPNVEEGVFFFPVSVNMPFEGLRLINRMLLKDKSRITVDELACSEYINQNYADDDVIARAGRA